MESLLQDVRYNFRLLLKSPGFTFIAVIALALGIGANTTVYSTVNAVVLHPFAFPDLDRMVNIYESIPKANQGHFNAAPYNFKVWHDESKSFEALAAIHGWDVNLSGEGTPQRLEGYQVSQDFFRVLGGTPELGRTFIDSDFQPGHVAAVVLSNGLWQRHFGSDPNIVGKTLALNGQNVNVVGVMGPDVEFPAAATEIWAPLSLTAKEQDDRENHYVGVIGRLKPGVSRAQAQAELNGIADRLAQQFPATNAGHQTQVLDMVADLTTGTRQFLLTLMGAAAFVLLLACANVANLQLARATVRQREIAVRGALGASRWRIVRQFLIESMLLSLGGGILGTLAAAWGVDVSRRAIPPFIYQHVTGLTHIQMDTRVLVFTLGIAVLTGVLAGVIPALHISRPDLNEALKEGMRGGGSSRARHHLRSLLVVSEVALALVLLVGAGLMVKGFRSMIAASQGFDPSNILTFRITLAPAQYETSVQREAFFRSLVGKLQPLPGVESAAVSTTLPSGWRWTSTEVQPEGQPEPAPGEIRSAGADSVSPDYFRALRVPLLRGRTFTAQDGPESTPVVIISDTMAHRFWANQDPMGRRVRLGRNKSEPWRTVVGIVGDVKRSAFDTVPRSASYVPFAQLPRGEASLVLKTTGDPLAQVAAARAQVQSVDAQQPVYDIRTLEQVVFDNVSGVLFSARMMTVFGMIALILAAAGLYAVMAYSVAQRTHEIGVRMALGAQRGDVLRMVVRYSMRLALIGLGIGLPVSFALSRVMASALLGVVRLETLTFVIFTALLMAVALMASYFPARRATQVDPIIALRYE